MPDALNQQNCRKYLMAFTDGELNVEKNLQVLEQMAMDPANTRRVMHQQQLRKACARALGADAPHCPDALRQSLEAMARDIPGGIKPPPLLLTPDTRHHSAWVSLRRWTPAAAAALFLSGALVALYSGSVPILPMAEVVSLNESSAHGNLPLSSDQIGRFSRRHVQCSRNLIPLGELPPEVPLQVASLPGPMSQYLDQPFQAHAPMDLSTLGYAFEKMGPCSLPGSEALHMIYQATPGSGRSDALSLWITEDAGNPLGLQPEKLYIAADDRHPHPILLWRHADRTYYLVGDAMDQVRQAADMLAIAPR